jgi:hypothetical protein
MNVEIRYEGCMERNEEFCLKIGGGEMEFLNRYA